MALIGFVACNNENKEGKDAAYKVNKDTVILAANSPIIKNLRSKEISTRAYSVKLSTSGTVKAIPNNYALVATPFAGRITKSYVSLGQEVKAGDPIFAISSPSFYEAGKAYYQTKEELDLATKNLKRQKDLLSKGVGVQKDMEEAEVNYAIKKKDYENAYASLKVFQVNPSSLVLGQPLIVRSPINGRIVENNIVIGQYIKEDSDPVATVAELSKIWVAAQVKEKDIKYLSDAAEVELKLVSFPDKVVKGKICHINSIIEEDTRSVHVLIECDNADKMMKPGMYVTAIFNHTIDNSIVVSSKAVFQRDDASYVFLQMGNNKYLKKKIETLTEDKDCVIIKSGIAVGNIIIENGGFLLLEEK